LDLENLAKGWYTIDGIWLGGYNWFVKATVITRLDEAGCDLSFITKNLVIVKITLAILTS